MAKPIEASAAAIVKINIAKICPIISSNKTEKIIKLRLTESKINSIDIKIIIIFLLFINIPIKPIINKGIVIHRVKE